MQKSDLVVIRDAARNIINSKTFCNTLAALKKSKGVRIEAILEFRAKCIT